MSSLTIGLNRRFIVMPKEHAFSTEKYVWTQVAYIKEKINGYNKGPTYIEFGGKPFGDFHAARVLPGYNEHCKAFILQELGLIATVVMVINARDIFPEPTGRYPNGRLRGDSGLRYRDETLRLIDEAHTFGIAISSVVISICPRKLKEREIETVEVFRNALLGRGVKLFCHFEISEYPHLSVLEQPKLFLDNDVVAEPGGNLIVLSPGGGSGKFGVILSELYYAIQHGESLEFH